jgi:hypothetical protein
MKENEHTFYRPLSPRMLGYGCELLYWAIGINGNAGFEWVEIQNP